MLVENNIYIYIYHPRDVCAIENAVAILPLIYKKMVTRKPDGKKMEIKVWSPIVFLLICFKKATKLKKYAVQMKFIYKNNPYLLKNSRGPACCHVNLREKKKLKINSVSMCHLIEPLFACNIHFLCLSGFKGKAGERRPRAGKCTMRSVPAASWTQGGYLTAGLESRSCQGPQTY